MFNQKIMVFICLFPALYLTYILLKQITTSNHALFLFCDAFHRSLLLGGCGWDFGASDGCAFLLMEAILHGSNFMETVLFLQPSRKSKSGSWRDEGPSNFFLRKQHFHFYHDAG